MDIMDRFAFLLIQFLKQVWRQKNVVFLQKRLKGHLTFQPPDRLLFEAEVVAESEPQSCGALRFFPPTPDLQRLLKMFLDLAGCFIEAKGRKNLFIDLPLLLFGLSLFFTYLLISLVLQPKNNLLLSHVFHLSDGDAIFSICISSAWISAVRRSTASHRKKCLPWPACS